MLINDQKKICPINYKKKKLKKNRKKGKIV